MITIAIHDYRGLKKYFLEDYAKAYNGITICFRDAGIKYDEKNAVLTDLTDYNGLSVGDWCRVIMNIDSDSYEPVEGVYWTYTKFKTRIILAFFQIEGTFSGKATGRKTSRIFCATGIEKPEDKNCGIVMRMDDKDIIIDEPHIKDDGKKRVKLIAVNLLYKI